MGFGMGLTSGCRLGALSVSGARVVNPLNNPLSALGAARLADAVDDAVEAGGQVGVAAVRGETHCIAKR